MGNRLFAFAMFMLFLGMLIGLVVPGLAESIHDNAEAFWLSIK